MMANGTQQATLWGEPAPSRVHWRARQTPGLLKSAVQKAIRRGDLGLLRWALDRVWRQPEGRAWLCRRLPILAAEEVWTHLGWAGYTARLAQGLLKRPEGEETALTLLEGALGTLADACKNKDGSALQALVPLGNGGTASVSDLAGVLETRQPVQVTEMILELLARRADPWLTLLAWASQHGTLESVLVVQEAKAGYAGGALENDRRFFVGGAVLAALYPEQVATQIRLQPFVAQPTLPPWGVADMHTEPGRRVLSLVAKTAGIPREALRALWFNFESAFLDRECTEGWWPRAVEARFHHHGYASVATARAAWDRLRPEVQAQVEARLPAAFDDVERWARG